MKKHRGENVYTLYQKIFTRRGIAHAIAILSGFATTEKVLVDGKEDDIVCDEFSKVLLGTHICGINTRII